MSLAPYIRSDLGQAREAARLELMAITRRARRRFHRRAGRARTRRPVRHRDREGLGNGSRRTGRHLTGVLLIRPSCSTAPTHARQKPRAKSSGGGRSENSQIAVLSAYHAAARRIGAELVLERGAEGVAGPRRGAARLAAHREGGGPRPGSSDAEGEGERVFISAAVGRGGARTRRELLWEARRHRPGEEDEVVEAGSQGVDAMR